MEEEVEVASRLMVLNRGREGSSSTSIDVGEGSLLVVVLFFFFGVFSFDDLSSDGVMSLVWFGVLDAD